MFFIVATLDTRNILLRNWYFVRVWSRTGLPVPAVNENIHPLWPAAQIAGESCMRQTREQQSQTGPEHRPAKFVVLIKENLVSQFCICQRIHVQCQQLVTKAEDLSPKLRLHCSCQRMPRGFHCSSKFPSNSAFLTNSSRIFKADSCCVAHSFCPCIGI